MANVSLEHGGLAAVIPPAIFDQTRKADNPTFVQRQHVEDPELEWRKLDDLVVLGNLMRLEVEPKLADLKHSLRLGDGLTGASAHHGANPQGQLLRTKWLYDVVVRSVPKALNDVLLVARRGKHDHRGRRDLSYFSAHLEPAHPRHPHVE